MVLTRRKYAGIRRKRVTKKRVGKMRGGTAPTSELSLQLFKSELDKLKAKTTLTDENKESINRLIEQIPDYIKDSITKPNLDDTDIMTKLNDYYNALNTKYGEIIEKLKPTLQTDAQQNTEEHVEELASGHASVVSQRLNRRPNTNSKIAEHTNAKNKAVNNLINSYKPANNNDKSYFKNYYYAQNITKKSLNNRKALVKSYLKNPNTVDTQTKHEIKLSQQNKKALKNSITDNLNAKTRLELIRDINSL